MGIVASQNVLQKNELNVIVDEYNRRAFNNPNDLILAKDGTIYFTDPPYGLSGQVCILIIFSR